jgi:hypothetical protein
LYAIIKFISVELPSEGGASKRWLSFGATIARASPTRTPKAT